MSPFYVTKNQHGYYRVIFVNQETGNVTVAKSTHSKNKTEAIMIASEWYKNGVPKKTTNSCTPFIQNTNYSSGLNLKNLISRLSKAEAMELFCLWVLLYKALISLKTCSELGLVTGFLSIILYIKFLISLE